MIELSTLVIRSLQYDDLDACAGLFVKTFNYAPWNEDWDISSAQQRLRDCFNTPGFVGWFTHQDDQPLGFALGHRESYNRHQHFFLKEMCVHPEYQRLGIGRQLMDWLKTALAQEQIDRIYLLTARDTPAEDFYASCGFHVSQRMILMGQELRFRDR